MVAPTETTRVLIVDDEPDVRRVLAELLKANGFECAEAADGQSALSLLNTGSYDLGIFDIVLPGMSGWELASIAQAISPDMRLIAVTGYECSADLADFGFLVALQKPLDFDTICGLCRRFTQAGS
jgi:CheY-like chemotaxis protein